MIARDNPRTTRIHVHASDVEWHDPPGYPSRELMRRSAIYSGSHLSYRTSPRISTSYLPSYNHGIVAKLTL